MRDWHGFFTEIRRSGLFGGVLTQANVDGVKVVAETARAHGATLEQAAYILATAYGETGGRMQPIRENMNYSLKRMKEVFSAQRLGPNPAALAGDPRALANQVYGGMLGNRRGTDDGWNFRGGGLGQTTGRDNYAKGAAKFGMTPEAFAEWNMTLEGGSQYLVRGMLEGWTTGKKLSDYVRPGAVDYVAARRTWNGTFAAAQYAGYARKFEAALRAGGYAPGKARPSAEKVAVVATAVATGTGAAVIKDTGVIDLGVDPMLVALPVAALVIVIIVGIIRRKVRK